LSDHQIIWWTPIPGDFIGHTGILSALGKLSPPQYNQLRSSVSFLTDRVKRYQASAPHHAPFIQPSVKWLQQVLDQIFSVQMPFRHLQFVVRDLQRVWLETWAMLDYMEIYRPRINGLTPFDSVANTIGTFTMNIRVAQDMFAAGLPCWLVRTSSLFSDDKIYSISQIFHPKDYIELEPHKHNYPVIFEGPATSRDKYLRIESYARNFLCSQDLFAMSCTPASTTTPTSSSGPSMPSTSTPPVASSSATRQSTGRQSRGAVHRPVKGRGAGEFSTFYI